MNKVLPLLLVACSAQKFDLAGEATDSATQDPADSDETDRDTGSDSATEPDADAAWYVLDAEVTVAGGVAVNEPASASITVYGSDLESELCTVPLDVSGLGAGPVAVNGVWMWWILPVVADDPCAPLPETLNVGVGEMVTDVRARLGAIGLDTAGDSLYGAYVSADGGTTAAFGVAGTETDYAGEGTGSRPLPDGNYVLTPLFLLPLGEEKQGGGAGP